jgi:hypothetical protein
LKHLEGGDVFRDVMDTENVRTIRSRRKVRSYAARE